MFRYFIYPLFLNVYGFALRLAALWNPKAKNWVKGRAEQHVSMDTFQNSVRGNKVIWMHCASLGEFEQGRPVLEALRVKEPTAKILLSFFSPSGYLATKHYKHADLVFYLPLDKKKQVDKLLDKIKPTLVIWVKYEFWFNYIEELKRRNIPIILIAAHFRKKQPFFQFYGSPWRKLLKSFSMIFVQQNSDKVLLDTIGLKNVTIGGDTRFDRVLELKKSAAPLPQQIINFVNGQRCIVAGSSWPEDEWQLVHFAKTFPKFKCIIVPHEVDEKSIQEVKDRFPEAIRFTEMNTNSSFENKQILIIDTIGLLSRVYQCATITYVGGGFNESGIHNTLEPAVWGKPVIFGPNYTKFLEARDMVDQGFAFSISTPVELENTINRILVEMDQTKTWENNAINYIKENAGATNLVIDFIYKNRLLIN